jgi:DNA-directed RNA polymerase subunit beta'
LRKPVGAVWQRHLTSGARTVAVDHPNEIWNDLQQKVHAAVQQNFPLEGRGKKLVLHGLSFDERKESPHHDVRSQEDAKYKKQTWGVPLIGDVGLVDKVTGKEIDRAKVKLLTLPKTTNRYSYIVDGSEWQVDNLWRLKSGVYAHVQQNGQLQAEFNLAKPFAREPRVYIPFDPGTKAFKFKYATTHVPLYSILRTMGVPDEDMKKAWGEEIYKANATAKVEKNIQSFYDRLAKRGVRAAGPSYDAVSSAVAKEFQGAKLLPETTKHVFGKPIDHVSGEALLLASKRILEVARGERPADDRDSLVFKKLHTVDDFLHEKLTHPRQVRTVQQKVGNNIDRQVKVRDIVTGDLFNRPVKEFFTTSTLSRNPEQVNPLEMVTNHNVTTILGADAGGISNDRAVTTAMRLINPSHLGFLDPIHGPESEKTGVSLHLPLGVKKINGEAKARVFDVKEGKPVWVTPGELHAHTIVMPDQVKWEDGKPKPLFDKVKTKDPITHDIVPKSFKDARFVLLSPHQLFNEATNLMPFLQNNQGNRAMTAARQQTQAVSLHHREAPLVQTQAGNQTWEKIIGQPFSHTSHVDGTIYDVKKADRNGHPESIVIKDAQNQKHEIQLYNHFPLNDSKTHLNSTPTVKVGDSVRKGQVVADTNFTRDGHLALGTNLRVGYIPYKGYNFEDGIVISDSASRKLSSEHVHRKELELDPEKDVLSKTKFTAYAPTVAKTFTKEQAAKLDDDGVVRVGAAVKPGDLLVAALGKRDLSGEAGRVLGRLSKRGFDLTDKSMSWESEHPGQVVHVVKDAGGRGVEVHIKTIEPAEVGDKIVGRHGNKAIITKILPDHEMPRIGGPDGTHIEVAMNPSGIASRINLGQMLETAASKIADKTGKPYLVNNFGGPKIDFTQKVKDELAHHGLKDTETLYDPATHKVLGDVLTGHQYILKLKHQVEKKLAVRSHSQNYTIDHAPKGTGADHPGQGVGQLELYALLAHGARHNLREMATYKADRHLDEQMNPMAHIDFWHRVQTGQPLPAPKPTFAYKKFEALLTGLGINIRKEGNQLQLTPLTDKGVLALSKGEIPDPGRVLRGKDARELEKGLFDPKVTGGLPNDVGKGLHWSHISLAEPMPNPVFVGTTSHAGPIPVLTGMRVQDIEEIAKGKKTVNGQTGGLAITDMLKKIDVKAELTKSKADLPKLRGTELDHMNRKVRYLQALDQLGMKPYEAYVMNHVPVLPPIFRPIVTLPNGSLRFDDINYYYRNLGLVNNQLKSPIAELGEKGHQPLREQAYDLLKSLAGLGGTPVYESNRPLKGVLDTVAGDQPKSGYFQEQLMKRRQELSMRSTITPEPAMHLDYVGLPRNAALELYKPFVIRELTRLGYDPLASHKEIKAGSPAAFKALEKAVQERPVLLKRDPALHKFSIMAFKPRLVEGRAIQIHPLVTAGYNADFDGDTMSAFVPLTDDAVREAHKMLPSNNLFSATHGGIMYAPDQESLMGLSLLGRWGKASGKSYSNFIEAKKGKDAGHITVNDVIKVAGKDTTLGRLMLAQHLPDEFKNHQNLLHNPNLVVVKRSGDDSPNRLGIHNLLEEIAKKDPKAFPGTVDALKNIGNAHSYDAGFSFRLADLHVPKAMRDGVVAKYQAEADKIHQSSLPQVDKHQKLVDVWSRATDDMSQQAKKLYNHDDNHIFAMVDTRARGNWAQFRQMNLAPMLLKDGQGRTISTPVTRSYSEGLDSSDYWTSLHGARMGTLQKIMGTSEPGRLSKEIVNTVIPSMIVSKNCGSTQGVSMHVDEEDVHDRFLALPVRMPGKTVAAGTLVTPDLTAQLKKHKIDKVVVRSPLKCNHGQGICAKCYGLNENGHLHDVGTNIGVIAGHALGEPATQLAMDSFHTGGVAASRGGGAVDKFTRLNQLLEAPKTLPNAAVLSKVSGRVSRIERDHATNGWNIHVGGEKHFTTAQVPPAVQVGHDIRKGDALTHGPINPHHLLDLTDIHTVQNYMTNELHNAIYKDERVKRRNIETVVRSLTNLTKIRDPGDSDHLHGDAALRTVVEEHNRGLKPGQQPIMHAPMVRGARQIALEQHEDWMARLNFQRLRDTVLEGAAKGWKSSLHGLNPLPSYAHGAEFGKGTKDKPHLY